MTLHRLLVTFGFGGFCLVVGVCVGYALGREEW